VVGGEVFTKENHKKKEEGERSLGAHSHLKKERGLENGGEEE